MILRVNLGNHLFNGLMGEVVEMKEHDVVMQIRADMSPGQKSEGLVRHVTLPAYQFTW